jgi:eukaryotic-like serine/threonine-protein kinase
VEEPLFPADGATLQEGRYVVRSVLGKRERAHLAHDTRVNRLVVIKHSPPDSMSDDAERAEANLLVQGEMQALASVSHPSVPAIVDSFTEDRYHFMVQVHVNGEDFQRKQKAQGGAGFPERQVLTWMSPVLGTLAYLADLHPQIIHRDIQPSNILVDSNNHVWVVDFGVASRKFRAGTPGAIQQIPSTAMGTPGYAPLEQFMARETTLTDLYALDATMHQLLTGRNPQCVEPLFQYPPISTLTRSVSNATIRVVEKAVQNDPAKRYQSAVAMQADVDQILKASGWRYRFTPLLRAKRSRDA